MATPPTEDRHATTEARLRAALTARAAQVTHHDLRREPPPRGRARSVRGLYGRGLAALAVAAAVAAVCLLALRPEIRLDPAPVQPARPPATGTDRPAPDQPPTPRPAAETPRVVPPAPAD
ncbi:MULTISPECIES: hypothetical protein [Streptomyces]|uniref:Uncharacterized protein n=1 Tax=Streptomyces venezuelae TaxID=54571 RepID=A0A5P2AU68_STRVZ|nr:hypothetical protein [Streptomyces venezuelae]QES21743.1 hypothetical protein DEJ46_23720 [Streptomyces venezuelae]